MGFRFRKSVNIGGFRINFSKSGVGYSVGGKGFRYTKKANGGHRSTFSVPGTGISYVTESGANKRKTANRSPRIDPVPGAESQLLYSIENSSDYVSASKQDFVDSIKRYYRIKRRMKWTLLWEFLLMIGLFVGTVVTLSNQPKTDFPFLFAVPLIIDSVALVATLVSLLVYRVKGKVKAEYTFDETGKQLLDQLEKSIACLKESQMIGRVHQVFAAEGRRYGGATRSVNMEDIRFKKKRPAFLKTNYRCYCVSLKRETYYVLPDMLIVVTKKAINAVSLDDIDVSIDSCRFVTEKPAKDATIVDYTWRYVNNNGTQDRRFSNNSRLAVTKCAVIDLTAQTGLNVRMELSNLNSAQRFGEMVTGIINHKNQMPSE